MIMMNNIVQTSFFFLACAASTSFGQLSPLLETPIAAWTTQLIPDVSVGSVEILKGNGAVMSPDGKTALVTTVGATVYAINAYSGDQLWTYQAPAADSSSVVRSRSLATVSPTEDYMAISVIDNENSVSPVT
jgi:outer membrane protein assembly factor BamB